jgi:hypothetical protein
LAISPTPRTRKSTVTTATLWTASLQCVELCLRLLASEQVVDDGACDREASHDDEDDQRDDGVGRRETELRILHGTRTLASLREGYPASLVSQLSCSSGRPGLRDVRVLPCVPHAR